MIEISGSFWIVLTGVFATASCGLLGTFLVLRKMSLLGDALSHAVLPGIAIAFLLSGSRAIVPMFLGATLFGLLTTLLVEAFHKKWQVQEDASIGVVFTALFALGVVLITAFAGQVDLDQECVLYGEIVNLPHQPPRIEIVPALSGIIDNLPLFHVFLHGNELEMAPDVIRMGFVALAVALLVWLFYKELLVSSFDPGLAFSLGINSTVVHYALMCLLSIVVVSAFESVGAILVVAMLILPGATAHLLSARLPVIMGLTVIHAFLSTLMGFHLATWLDCSIASAFVVAGMGLFLLAWLLSPYDGLLAKWHRHRNVTMEPPEPLTESSLEN